jgi:hypothetical protein
MISFSSLEFVWLPFSVHFLSYLCYLLYGAQRKVIYNRANTNIRKNSFSIRIAKYWNKLPENIVNAPSINSFKTRLDKHLRQLKFDFVLCLTYGYLWWFSGTGSLRLLFTRLLYFFYFSVHHATSRYYIITTLDKYCVSRKTPDVRWPRR